MEISMQPERETNGMQTQAKGASVELAHVLAVCPAIIYSTQASGDFACAFVSENIEKILGCSQHGTVVYRYDLNLDARKL
jgi:hypothetical protein